MADPPIHRRTLLPDRVDRAGRAPVLRPEPTPRGVYEARGEGVPLREYLSALRRYWWLVAAAVSVSVGIAAWKVSREMPMYLASTSVRLVDPSVRMAGDLSAGSEGNQLPGWYTDPILSQIQLLRSRNVAGMVVDTLGLRLQPVRPNFPYAVMRDIRVSSAARPGDTVRVSFSPGGVVARARETAVRAAYGEPVDLAGVRFTVASEPADFTEARFLVIDRNLAIDQVLNGLQARPREMTNVLDVVYTSFDPTLAKRVADAAAISFQQADAASAQQESRRRRLFIEEQLRSTDSLLLAGQRELSAFRKEVQAFSPQEKFRNAQQAMSEFRLKREALSQEKQIFDRMGEELTAGRGREDAEQIAALAASPEVSNNAGIIRLYDQLVRFQTLRDSMATGVWSRAATNPDVQRVDSLIATAQTRLVRAVQGRSVALAAQIGVLDELMATDAASIRGLPDAEAEEMRLSRQVETLQTLVDDLLREQQKARIDEAVEAGQVEIVDAALVPGGPIGRGTRRRLLFALFVGLMVGGSGALVLDRMNTALQKREDVEALLHLPTLAIIPRVGEAPGPGRLKLGRALARRGDDAGRTLITVTDLHSAASQAYRKLRTHLLFSGGNGRLRTLLVTSPAASEGKSTISSNLAVTVAQQNLRVVLVDGDLRRSRLHSIFTAPRLPGLVEVLNREATLDEAVRPTAVEGLDLLPAGKLVPNASELLGSNDMHRLLEALAARYDLVVVDTSPVLAAADAEILGVQTDGVLVVARAGQTERYAAQYAVQQLRAIGARLVGAVLNDPDHKVAGYGRYAYYYDDYTSDGA